MVKTQLDGGAYRKIYECQDINTGENHVVKFSEEYELLASEIKCMIKL